MHYVYMLRRGRTSAVVEWARGKMWSAMCTRKRTIHIFALNPLGGKPDGFSHLAGKVTNSQEFVRVLSSLHCFDVLMRRRSPLRQSYRRLCVYGSSNFHRTRRVSLSHLPLSAHWRDLYPRLSSRPHLFIFRHHPRRLLCHRTACRSLCHPRSITPAQQTSRTCQSSTRMMARSHCTACS